MDSFIQKTSKNQNSIVIGSDTIVGIDNKVLCKPKDEEEAYNMLKTLSGKIHTVYTGLAVVLESENYSFVTATETKVKFFDLAYDKYQNSVDAPYEYSTVLAKTYYDMLNGENSI